MDDISDLYQELILDHNKSPRNKGKLDKIDKEFEGYNPLCGDKVNIFLDMDGDKIVNASFEASGCAISVASASILTEIIKDKTVSEINSIFEQFTSMLITGDKKENMGKLSAFGGVSKYPARVKCATLSWHTLKSALEG